jgi:tetratricopeptide (TPR) repeat protein
MKGVRYFLALMLGIVFLVISASLVYRRLPGDARLASATPVAPSVAAAHDSTPAMTHPVAADSTPPAVTPPVTARASSAAPIASAPAQPVSRRTASHPTFRPPVEDRGNTGVDASPPADSTAQVPAVAAPVPAADTVPRDPPAWQASPRQVARDSAYIMVSSGRLRDGIAVLDAWVREHPTDTAVALDLARLLARNGEWERSVGQYTALIELERTPELLYERGQTYLWSGDAARAEADLLASESLRPRAATERQLGDHYRWQGDLARSASWYRRALRSAPDDTLAREALRHLDRAIDARLLAPGELGPGNSGSTVQAISDNAGFDLYVLRLGQAFAVPMGASSSLAITGELRSASNSGPGAADGHLDAYGGDLSLATRIGLSKLSLTLGMLDHGDAGQVVRGGASIDGFLGNARLRAGVRRAPAYELLWAPRLLGTALATGEDAQSALHGQASLSLPVGARSELWVSGEHLRAGGDNTRVGLQGALRRRVAGPLSITYSAGYMAYDHQVPLYYSPSRYVSQALGAELSRYREEGVSFALRFAPGYAWIREVSGTSSGADRDASLFQFTGGLELGYRRNGWDVLLSSGYGSGREGGYRSGSALLSIRRSW